MKNDSEKPEPITVLWTVDLSQSSCTHLLACDDLLLLATQERSQSPGHSALHALSVADGSLRWRKACEHALVSGLAQLPRSSELPGSLILASIASADLLRGAGALLALDAAGNERWRWAAGVQKVSAPALARSDDLSRPGIAATKVATTNLVCVAADARTLVVLDLASGAEWTRIPLPVDAALAAPLVVGDVVYVPCRGPRLLAWGLDGQMRWQFDAQAPSNVWLDRTPVVVGDALFATLTRQTALALNVRDGSLRWQVPVGPAGRRLSPPATDGRRLYVGARDGLHAMDLSSGHEVWSFPTSKYIEARPVVHGGVVYVACHDRHLYALDAGSGQELWRYPVGRRIEVSPAITATSTIIADQGGTVTAIARPPGPSEHQAPQKERAAPSPVGLVAEPQSVPLPPAIDRAQLLRILCEHFSLEDLRTLCYHLDVEFDDLGGEGRKGKARELLRYLERYNARERLVEWLHRERPDIII
jgi:outer membrane protein assembly factor BamB